MLTCHGCVGLAEVLLRGLLCHQRHVGLHGLGLCAMRLAEKRRAAKRIRHLLHLEEVLGLHRRTRVGIGVPCGGSRMSLCQCRASI